MKTPYECLKKEVFKTLEHYTKDFEVIDKNYINDPDCGEFILAVRKMGTNLILKSVYKLALEQVLEDPGGCSAYLFGTVRNEDLLEKVHEGQIETINFLEKNHKEVVFFYYSGSGVPYEVSAEVAREKVEEFYEWAKVKLGLSNNSY